MRAVIEPASERGRDTSRARRAPKQGFRTPVVELFRGALGTWAAPILLDSGLTREGLLRRDHLAETLRRHRAGERDYSNRLWAAMSLNLWHERWIGATAAESAA